jgi:hypothetical protein
MLQFRQDDTSVELILTLTEKVTLTDPYYLFVFTHVTTKDVVAFVKSVADDESGFQSRYNKFTIDPSDVFEDKLPGEWHYKVYEQEDVENTDVALTGAEIECGKLMLLPAEDFEYDKYNSPTSFKTYNG